MMIPLIFQSMCCKPEIFVMAPVGTQLQHNQGHSNQHGPCQSSWFTGADSSENVMKKMWVSNLFRNLSSVPFCFQFLSFICNFSWHLRGWHQRRWYHWKWRGARNSSSVRTHLCQFLYSHTIWICIFVYIWSMYPFCCALIPFNKMCINSSMWGSYLGGCPFCPGLLGVKRGCIAFPMDGKYMESLCPSSLGENGRRDLKERKRFWRKIGEISWK